MKIYLLFAALLGPIGTLGAGDYSLTRTIIARGGAVSTLAITSGYQLNGTTGQAVAGYGATANKRLWSGFWTGDYEPLRLVYCRFDHSSVYFAWHGTPSNPLTWQSSRDLVNWTSPRNALTDNDGDFRISFPNQGSQFYIRIDDLNQ